MRKLGIVAFGAALGSCASAPEPATGVAVSMDREGAKREILLNRTKIWKDPYSVREAKLGDVMACPGAYLLLLPAAPSSNCACVEVNAKNSYGGYTGLRRTVMIFPAGGGLLTSDAGIRGFPMLCEANLLSFPELDGDYVEPKPSPAPRAKRTPAT